jgi:hypothetical protein
LKPEPHRLVGLVFLSDSVAKRIVKYFKIEYRKASRRQDHGTGRGGAGEKAQLLSCGNRMKCPDLALRSTMSSVPKFVPQVMLGIEVIESERSSWRNWKITQIAIRPIEGPHAASAITMRSHEEREHVLQNKKSTVVTEAQEIIAAGNGIHPSKLFGVFTDSICCSAWHHLEFEVDRDDRSK